MTQQGTDPAARVRAGVGLFEMDDRGLLEVRGADRIRWLDGMITADVKRLDARGEGAGAPALLLTHRGAIVADLHVGRHGDVLLIECAREAIPRIRTALERRIIADDVVLAERSEDFATLGVEGSAAVVVVEGALEAGGVPEPESWSAARIAGEGVLLARFGWSGEPAIQIRMAPGARGRIAASLEASARAAGVDCLRGDRPLLERLRIEAGIPALGSELDEDVLPPEARLERAIAVNKGCYVGQEIVARLRSRGQVNHLLVGLRIDGEIGPAVGAGLSVGGRTTGEITSRVRSPSEGWIALAYVRREHAEPGTAIEVAATAAQTPGAGDREEEATAEGASAAGPGAAGPLVARVVDLPFVPPVGVAAPPASLPAPPAASSPPPRASSSDASKPRA